MKKKDKFSNRVAIVCNSRSTTEQQLISSRNDKFTTVVTDDSDVRISS